MSKSQQLTELCAAFKEAIPAVTADVGNTPAVIMETATFLDLNRIDGEALHTWAVRCANLLYGKLTNTPHGNAFETPEQAVAGLRSAGGRA